MPYFKNPDSGEIRALAEAPIKVSGGVKYFVGETEVDPTALPLHIARELEITAVYGKETPWAEVDKAEYDAYLLSVVKEAKV